MKKASKYLKIIVGSFLIAFSLNIFFNGTNLIPAGIYGFAVLYHSKVTMDLWLIILLLNAFFFTLGMITIPRSKLKRALLPFLMIPIFLFITNYIIPYISLEGIDKLLISIYGGVFFGLGIRLIYKENNYASGTDIITLIVNEIIKTKTNIVNYILDIIWLIIGTFCYGIEGAMYSLITIIIIEILSHRAKLGVSDSKVFYIITKKADKVRDYIINELHYDLTIFDVKGGFLKAKNKVLMSVIPTKDYYRLKEGIKEIDPKAFISITDSYEVINQNRNK